MSAMNTAQVPKAQCVVAGHRRAHPRAFSSGQVSTCKRRTQHRQQAKVNRDHGHIAVRAVAATDVGTKAVQAIKKSVGGDVFVAGDPTEPATQRVTCRSTALKGATIRFAATPVLQVVTASCLPESSRSY